MLARLKHFLSINILFIAIGVGIFTYFLFHYVTFLAPIKYPLKAISDTCVPYLIFIMLFIAFCKVEVKKMRPRPWHAYLVLIQVGVPCVFAALLYSSGTHNVVYEGIIACVICPTAAAASVITGKLGGDESSLTTYTILSNIAAAISIPLIFSFVTLTGSHGSFLSELWVILMRVFPMIVLPLFLAQFIRYALKGVHKFIVHNLKDVSFYLWALTLSTISATAVSNMMNSDESGSTLIVLAVVGLVTTALQFAVGKLIGNFEGQRISAGQGLGQKNMVFGIWVSYTYLSPASAIAAGFYILWQNIVNSWQLWYRDHKKLTYTDKM